MTVPSADHEPEQVLRSAGISVALRVDAGMNALLVGAGDGALGEAMASTGATVTMLEADATLARTAATRLVSQPSAHVVGTTLVDWVEDADSTASPFDVVVFAEPPPATAVATATLEEVLDRVDVLLQRAGTLVVAFRNERGLSRVLGVGGGPGGHSPLHLARRLDEHGLDQQRWLLPYPDHHRPQAIVDVELFEQADGASLIASIVREPVAAVEGQAFLSPPLRAFRVALDAGLAPAVADSVIILASGSHDALADTSRPGLVWTVPPPDLAPRWQCPRELAHVSGRYLWHPIAAHRTSFSGPLLLEPATIAVPTGRNGEDVVVDALMDPGAFSATSRQVLTRWWQAAEVSLAASEPGRRPLSLRPRDFIVDEDGAWHHQAQDLAMRFPVPAQILAYGALVDTIADAILARGWLLGLGPDTTVGQAARALLVDIGVTCDEAIEYLWLETTADLVVRSMNGIEREDARQSLLRRAAARLDSGMGSMPVSELVAAGTRLPEVSARLAAVQAELAEVQTELLAAQAKLAAAQTELAGARAATERPGAGEHGP